MQAKHPLRQQRMPLGFTVVLSRAAARLATVATARSATYMQLVTRYFAVALWAPPKRPGYSPLTVRLL